MIVWTVFGISLGAIIGTIAVGVVHDRRFRDERRRRRRHRIVREIRGGITVYEMCDGREVNRRNAYPHDAMFATLGRIRANTRAMTEALNGLAESAVAVAERMSRMQP